MFTGLLSVELTKNVLFQRQIIMMTQESGFVKDVLCNIPKKNILYMKKQVCLRISGPKITSRYFLTILLMTRWFSLPCIFSTLTFMLIQLAELFA